MLARAFTSVISLPILFEAEWGLSLEAELVVTYTYEPAQRGGRDRYGWDEEIPERIDIEEAQLMFAGRVLDANPKYDANGVLNAIRDERRAAQADALEVEAST